MANQSIGIGSAADDGTGDNLRVAIDKVNDNFLEIYTLIGDASSLTSGISATASVVTLTAALATTSFSPSSADGATLGTTSLEWSDIYLADSSVIYFGADQDTTLTHVADTGVLLNSTRQLQFGDSGTYIHQSADGVLDLVADTEIEINATTIDVNGNLDVSGTLVVGSTLTASTISPAGDLTLDVGGDIILDAGGADIVFKDDGTTIATHTNSSSDYVITTAVSDKDFVIKGNDGGATITPFTLDMSAGGNLFLTGGLIDLKNNGSAVSQIKFYCESSNAHAQTLIGAPHSESANNVLTLPSGSDGVLVSTTSTATLTNKTLTAPTITGTATMADLDISGNVDIDGTLEADAITVNGATLAETISDTVGAMVGSNTETGITVTYEDGDNTLDFVLGTSQTTITSLTNTSLVIGRDADNDIDFATDNNIIFRAGGADQIKLIDGALAPVTDNDIDLGTSSLEFKDAFFDGTVTSDAFAGPLTGNASTATALETARTIGGTSFDGTANIAVALATLATTVTITDNESTNENNALIFTAGGDVDGGNLGLESDGTLTYNPSTGKITATGFVGTLTGNVTGNTSGTAATVTGAAQTNITSVGTLTALQVDNININGNAITSTAGTDLTITPLSGQQIVLDGAIVIDAGVVTGATSITSTAFVGGLTGNASTATALATARTIAGVSFDGTANITIAPTDLTSVTAVAGEINALDLGSTAIGNAIASKAMVLDANKDYTGGRNFTITGELDAATGDFSGAVDVAGATTVAALTASGILKTDDATDATSTTDGSLQTDGGLSVAKDVVAGNDIKLLSDAAVITMGANSEINLTHVHDTGITTNGEFTSTVIRARKPIKTEFNASGSVTASLTAAESGATILIHGTENNVINLPAAATTNPGLYYDFIVMTAVGGSTSTIVNIAGSGGNFVGALSLAGGTAANAVFDNAGDAFTFVASTVVGSRARITCLTDDGTDGVWQVESVASPIATID